MRRGEGPGLAVPGPAACRAGLPIPFATRGAAEAGPPCAEGDHGRPVGAPVVSVGRMTCRDRQVSGGRCRGRRPRGHRRPVGAVAVATRRTGPRA